MIITELIEEKNELKQAIFLIKRLNNERPDLIKKQQGLRELCDSYKNVLLKHWKELRDSEPGEYLDAVKAYSKISKDNNWKYEKFPLFL